MLIAMLSSEQTGLGGLNNSQSWAQATIDLLPVKSAGKFPLGCPYSTVAWAPCESQMSLQIKETYKKIIHTHTHAHTHGVCNYIQHV